MKSSRFSFERSVMFTRRTATVTTSAPETSIAFLVSAKSLYLPVPTHSLDLNSRPAITSRSLCMGRNPPYPAVIRTTAADEAQNLHAVPCFEATPIEFPAIQNFQVQFHSHPLSLEVQFPQQITDRGSGGAIARFAVDLNLQWLNHGLQS